MLGAKSKALREPSQVHCSVDAGIMADFKFAFQFVNAKETIALGSALPAVCMIVVALRFLTRRLQNVIVGIDDWLAVCGLVRAIFHAARKYVLGIADISSAQFAVMGMGACLIVGILHSVDKLCD